VTARPAYYRGEVVAGAALVTLALIGLVVRAVQAPAAAPAVDARPAVLDVNTASLDALTVLPGVGPATAGRLVAARPFRSLDDVRAVLGDDLFLALRPHLALGAGEVAPVPSR
jgi:DNA uptake protein ComE-like DNA-binding protein